MFGLGRPRPIAEQDAKGEIDRVYDDIRQTLRVSGIGLVFRVLAGYERLLPVLWDVLRPNVETRDFEAAADCLRSAAVWAAQEIGRLGAHRKVRLGESQQYQVQAAIDLYHYADAKLLLLTSAVCLALHSERAGRSVGPAQPADLIERGVPPRMYPMEMVAEAPEQESIKALFSDIGRTATAVMDEYRTLALWPEYLAAVWNELKPIHQRANYLRASRALRDTSRALARELPFAMPLPRERIESLGIDAGEVVRVIGSFERVLPSMVLTMALAGLDWRPAERLAQTPFPAAVRAGAADFAGLP